MHKVQLLGPRSVNSLTWTSLASDPKADVLQARLPDARELSYAIDPEADLLWIKVSLFDRPPSSWFGISVVVDIDGVSDNGMTWWGTNKVKFDRLANAFLFKADGYWQGYLGVGDSEAVARGYTGGLTKDVIVAVDQNQPALLLGIPRSTLGSAPTVRITRHGRFDACQQ